MRMSLTSLAILVSLTCLASTQAYGQRRVRGKKAAPAKPTATPAAPAPEESRGDRKMMERCHRIKDAIDANSRNLEILQANSARYDIELRAAQQRIKELEKLRADVSTEIRRLEQRLRLERRTFDKNCDVAFDCDVYERYIDQLESRMKPLEAALANIERSINETNTEVAQLEKQIPPVQREYGKLACHDLKPGETTQETISRCFALMSDWNDLQTRINNLRDRLPGLEASFASYSRRLTGMQDPLDEYAKLLDAHCKTSGRVKTIRDMRSRKDRYNKLGDTIQQTTNRLNKLQNIRIGN